MALVIPAEAGIAGRGGNIKPTPAFAGVTEFRS